LLWQHYGNAWQSPAVIRQAQRTPHALRTHARTSDKIDAPAACATLSATRPFHFVHTARVLQHEREMLASTCLGRGRGCPLVVHYWADLQSVHRLRCYGNITRTLVYAGVRTVADSDQQVTEAFSTLLPRPGLRASNGGVLAT